MFVSCLLRKLSRNSQIWQLLLYVIWKPCYQTVLKLVDTQIMFLSQLDDKLWRKTEKKFYLFLGNYFLQSKPRGFHYPL